ncbi:HoxN/HupN/NixA family nickel/cobalt transporter [Arthrobacter sp. AFG20]|uniref:HoxN/HupN/NixA family nickel/cobalt transporter n=1 Tax=Arthrobacter sp. AFG20 TaxID=1688671 RepID=UPI000C9E9130|nr:nickel transporter [Arthrobacter sp. AFG20]PNH83493.1 nickel transporter [Arthrobacter sp. AFG20]
MTTLTQFAAMYREREQLPLRTRLLATFSAVGILHLAAAVLLVAGTAASGQPLALGLVLTAYLAGIKHSYDWDHIAAIDNSTRKFVAQRQDPTSVGFAFSLGHSSVVILAGALVVSGVSLVGRFMTEGSTGNLVLGLIGSGVSGLFLLAMGLFNGSAFLGAARSYRRVRGGGAVLPEELEAKGFVARLLARPLSKVRRPRNVYVIGFLFGLGFDTATTIGLLVMTTAASLAGVSPVALLALPLAFTAAMTLCDTTNGVAMMRMYKSAIHDPLRKLGFNAVITGLSALSALFVALITLAGFCNAAFALKDPLTGWLGTIDLGDAGLLLVAAFLALWGMATLRARRRAVSQVGP